MDLALDQRPGFDGREYLSGEWAAAISFNGGPPMWLTPWMLFPHWPTGFTFVELVPVEPMDLRNQIGLGFQLLTNSALEEYSDDSPHNWMPSPLPMIYNPKTPESFWWRIPIDKDQGAHFYLVEPILGSVV
jgi:hypothetical protein